MEPSERATTHRPLVSRPFRDPVWVNVYGSAWYIAPENPTVTRFTSPPWSTGLMARAAGRRGGALYCIKITFKPKAFEKAARLGDINPQSARSAR